MGEIRVLGKINLVPLVAQFGEIQTDEIIITDERLQHIKERHQEDFTFFLKYIEESVTNPDYIINDGKNAGTVFMVKKLDEMNINVVVIVALSSDKTGIKNSVMTFHRLRDKNLMKIIKKNVLLYKKE